MPNDDNREMLTEVVALYLAAHMKAQAAVTTALVAILIQKGVLTDQVVRAELLGALEGSRSSHPRIAASTKSG
jgi:hypothetical protein